MSERDARAWATLKADPVRYEKYLARKAKERKARPEYERERKARWRAKNPESVRRIRDAGHAVEKALRQGKLVKPRLCEECRKPRKVEAHHHNGYGEAHWLDVIWLCASCHQGKHAQSSESESVALPLIREKGGKYAECKERSAALR